MILLDDIDAVLLVWLSAVLVKVRKGGIDAADWRLQALTRHRWPVGMTW